MVLRRPEALRVLQEALTYTIRDNPEQRTVSLVDAGARKGQDIIEGANGALGLAHLAAIKVSAGTQIPNGEDYEVEVCASSTTATRSADNTYTSGEDFVVQNTDNGNTFANACNTFSNLKFILNSTTENEKGVVQLRAFGDTVAEAPETVTVTLTLVNNPGGLLQLGTSTLTYTIRDNPEQRTVSLVDAGARKGQDIIEGANGALGLAHLAAIKVSAGTQIPNGEDYEVEVCASSTTATRSADNTYTSGEDFVVQNTDNGNTFANACNTFSNLKFILNSTTENEKGVVQLRAFGDTVAEAPETVTVTLTLVNNPGGLLQLGTSTLTYTIRDGQPFSHTCAAHPLSVNKSPLTIQEDKSSGVRVINYPENGRYFCTIGGMSTFVSIPPPAGVTGVFAFETTQGGSLDARNWNDDKLTGDRCGPVHPVGDLRYQLCVIDDENIPPASTEFKLLDGGRSISINEGQEATHKVIVGKPVAQTALPCFTWGKPSVVRDVLFDRGKALDASGCMKSWPGTPHVGNVIMDLYINTNDDNVVGADPQFTIGLKNTRKDGSSEPNAGSQAIEVTVVNDDHTDEVVVRPHPAPMTWVEVKEFFDNLSATAEDRKFSDGTFCNAETPGTRTVTAPGGSGSTRTCVKYFARHATHLKWSTGRATPFSYILRAWGPGEGGGRNFVTIAANTGYSAGKTALDQTAFACNSPEQRAREITISVREAADWSNELSSPALAPGSAKFPICAHEMPGRDYTYTDGSSLPVGVRSEPPKDVDRYPATEGAYAELPRAEILVAESTPYVDIRNARKTKFVKEGRRARFFVELSAEATQDVAVEWRVRPSVEHPRATLGEDVEKASGTLVIAQGETRGEIRVKTYEDSHDDDREKFRVRITSAEGAVIRQQRAHAIIRNDDSDAGGVAGAVRSHGCGAGARRHRGADGGAARGGHAGLDRRAGALVRSGRQRQPRIAGSRPRTEPCAGRHCGRDRRAGAGRCRAGVRKPFRLLRRGRYRSGYSRLRQRLRRNAAAIARHDGPRGAAGIELLADRRGGRLGRQHGVLGPGGAGALRRRRGNVLARRRGHDRHARRGLCAGQVAGGARARAEHGRGRLPRHRHGAPSRRPGLARRGRVRCAARPCVRATAAWRRR